MADYLTQLEKLKTVVRTAIDFSEAWNNFFDLTEQADFVELSKPSQLDHLVLALDAMANVGEGQPKRTFQPPVVMQYPGSNFYHGTVSGTGCMGVYLYFKDLDIGMLALTDVSSMQSTFFRFALTLVNEQCTVVLAEPSSDSRAIH